MPELPEAEVTRLVADRTRVRRCWRCTSASLCAGPWGSMATTWLAGGWARCSCRGKYLWLPLNAADGRRGGLLIHLGMSGSLSFAGQTGEPGPHDHFDLVTSRGVLRRTIHAATALVWGESDDGCRASCWQDWAWSRLMRP